MLVSTQSWKHSGFLWAKGRDQYGKQYTKWKSVTRRSSFKLPIIISWEPGKVFITLLLPSWFNSRPGWFQSWISAKIYVHLHRILSTSLYPQMLPLPLIPSLRVTSLYRHAICNLAHLSNTRPLSFPEKLIEVGVEPKIDQVLVIRSSSSSLKRCSDVAILLPWFWEASWQLDNNLWIEACFW